VPRLLITLFAFFILHSQFFIASATTFPAPLPQYDQYDGSGGTIEKSNLSRFFTFSIREKVPRRGG
jgi:hypothetical protein